MCGGCGVNFNSIKCKSFLKFAREAFQVGNKLFRTRANSRLFVFIHEIEQMEFFGCPFSLVRMNSCKH
ncbi:hypothetical protein SUGI_0177020 [Cryptomeria japonica]|nr:hypothetical protein SUGI_0177020 [Cryptomeria japonica]